MAEIQIQNYNSSVVRKYFWLLLSRIMPLFALFIITIIYSRQLSYDDYGRFQSVWMYANIVNVIISFGISAVILSTNINFLFSFIKNNRKILGAFYSILWVMGLIAFYLFAKNFDVSLKLLLIIFIITQNIVTASETLLIKRGKEKASSIINFLYALLFLGWHLYILLTTYSLYHLIVGIIIISILKLIAIAAIRVKNEEFEETINEKHFLNHWFFLGMNDVLGVIARWMDKLFLLYLLTATDFAVFFNGSFEIPLFGLLISVTGSFLLIEISGDIRLTNKITRLYSESFKVLSSIVFPLFFFLFFFREELFSLAFNDKYNASIPIFAISIFILPMRINNYSAILQCFSQGKKVLWGSLLDIIIASILMLTLYPLIGTRGIVLAIVISTYCQNFYYLWNSAKILNISIFRLLPLQTLIIKFLIILILYFILSFFLSGMELKMKLLSGTIFTALTVVLGMMPYFKTFFKKNHV